MKNHNLFTALEFLLRNENDYCSEGCLLKNKIVEDALALNPKLIALILKDESLKNNFFVEVDGMLIFDKIKFQKFVMNKQFLPDSYTSFKNKIGLTNEEDKFIAESREVVLSWPYKDCILEGGQTKEDAKRKEVFWNEILAPDDINRLTEPKVLTNFKKYDANGEHKLAHISLDDNLIIKGNNLLALHSLKKIYAGKVKLIYIDPPYYFSSVKEADAFKYNSNFRLSTWLTFMHNRLTVAKTLLAKGGVILCHINEDGCHWLKMLMSEIFGTENFVETFIWKNTDNPASLSLKSRSAVEYVLCYEVPLNASNRYLGKETENGDAPLLNRGNPEKILEFPSGSILFKIADGLYEKGIKDRVELITDCIVKNGKNEGTVKLKGELKWSQQTLNDEIAKGTYFVIKSDKFSIRFQREHGAYMAPEKFINDQYLSKSIGVGTNEDASSHLKKLGLKFSYSKPESIVAFFLKAVTQEHDIVLDFFLGSGTTAAVAHKMKRRYIGIEQMDYIQDIACSRISMAIGGEDGGVSKQVNWTGGGSFVYCELAKSNQRYIDEINSANDTNKLINIWESLQDKEGLSWKVNVKTINSEKETFNQLTLEEQKMFLIECLDKNMLYVPYSEIENEEFQISEADKALNREFYQE